MELESLEAFRNGDRKVLEQVYCEHVEAVRRNVRAGLRRAGALSASNLEDIVQETFVKAFSRGARERYDGTRDYAPYLLAIARNSLVDWLRCTSREVHLNSEHGSRIEPLLVCRTDESAPFCHELLAATARYVSGLPSELRALHQRRFEGAESQQRAAEALGISRQRLRTLEQRLLKGLRREITRAAWAVEPGRRARAGSHAAAARTDT